MNKKITATMQQLQKKNLVADCREVDELDFTQI